MVKVAMLGAGSLGFTEKLVADILSVPELQDTEFWLMDIDQRNLDLTTKLCLNLVDTNGLPAKVHATTDRRAALRGADYVISMMRVGGLDAMAYDVEIPLKYGVAQCVADTLGPGGIFYALRTIPVLLEIAADMRELAPKALMLSYANPMAMNCWALNRAGGVPVLGLCHGVQNTHKLIAKALGVTPEQMDSVAVGINHQTWFLQVMINGQDVRYRILDAFRSQPELAETEPLRLDILERFGYFSTESNGHLSEYLPWYRKNVDTIGKWTWNGRWNGGITAGYLEALRTRRVRYDEAYPDLPANHPKFTVGRRSPEHASYIIESLETGRLYRGNFNVQNNGIVTNLPANCIVEVPCFVDRTGIYPGWVGALPLQCAATCRASISVQEMAVEAAITGNRDLVKLAVLHDPLTAAVCTPDQVWQMCDELFAAEARWLPQFNGKGRHWPDISAQQ